jgi:hypothetical protein
MPLRNKKQVPRVRFQFTDDGFNLKSVTLYLENFE